jgi:hypothetical protein
VLKSAIIPNTQYNINTYNNTFHFPNDNSTAPHDYVVPVGQYTMDGLIETLEGMISGLSIAQDDLTQKLTMGFVGTCDYISDVSKNPMAEVLGMKTTSLSMGSLGSLYECESLPDLSGLDNIYISSQTLSNHSAMITSDKLKQNVFCNVPINVPFGATKVSEEDETTLDYSVFSGHKNISSIDIALLDERNNVLDLNGADWVLIFRVYM